MHSGCDLMYVDFSAPSGKMGKFIKKKTRRKVFRLSKKTLTNHKTVLGFLSGILS